MQVLPNFVDMAKTPELQEEKTDSVVGPSHYPQNIYPYGLCICLDNDSLEKLNLDADCEVGDMVHLQAIGKVTSASQNETTEGVNKRVEIQITHIALAEEHDDQEAARPRKMDYGKLYNAGG